METKKILEAIYNVGDEITEIKWSVDYYDGSFQIKKTFDKITFTKEMLEQYIGEEWFDFYFDDVEDFGKLKNLIDRFVTGREIGKSWKIVAICFYMLVNFPLFNAVFTRKYNNNVGGLWTFFVKVANDIVDHFGITFSVIHKKCISKKKSKPRKKKNADAKETIAKTPVKYNYVFKTLKEKNAIVGDFKNNSGLFMRGKTNDGRTAIFYDVNLNNFSNQMITFRSSDDPNGNRGISPYVGYFAIQFDEEFAQEEDSGLVSSAQQIARYTSLYNGLKRYITEMKNKKKLPDEATVVAKSMANGWDPKHGYIEALLEVLPEKEYRAWIKEDPENHYLVYEIVEDEKGNLIRYVRGTALANFQLYPKGSKVRAEKVELIKKVIASGDEYDMASECGFIFPGFLSPDNPVYSGVSVMKTLPKERKMSSKRFRNTFKDIEGILHGTDWGLSDATCDVPAVLAMDKYGEPVIGIGVPFWIKNKNAKVAVRSGQMKKELIAHWIKWKQKWGLTRSFSGDLYWDSAAKSVIEDIEDEKLGEERNQYNGDIIRVLKQPQNGYGLEDRPNEFNRFIENPRVIFLDGAEEFLIQKLNTLKPKDEESKQPHPRKGEMDVYDAICMLIFGARHELE